MFYVAKLIGNYLDISSQRLSPYMHVSLGLSYFYVVDTSNPYVVHARHFFLFTKGKSIKVSRRRSYSLRYTAIGLLSSWGVFYSLSSC